MHLILFTANRNRVKLLFTILLCTSLSYAQTFQQAIKVGFFSNNQYLLDREKLLQNYTLYKELDTKGTKLYVINDNSSIEKLFKEVKTLVPDAFITTVKIVSQKEYKIELLKVIRIGTYLKNKKALEHEKLLKDYSIHKQVTPSGTRLYIVPEDSQNIKEFLKRVRKLAPDSYITLAPLKIEIKKDSVPIKAHIKKDKIQVPTKAIDISKPTASTWEYAIDISDIQFKKAMKLYDAERYKDAHSLLSSIMKNHTTKVDSNLVDFYLGKSAYKLGKYLEALIAFSRLTVNDPTNLHVKLEIAQTYIKMGLIEEAKSEFNYLLTKEISESLKKDIKNNLDKIDKKEQKNFIYGIVMAGVKYDTNINNESDQISYRVYEPDYDTYVDISSIQKEHSIMYDIGAVVRHLYKSGDGFYLKNTLTAYALTYPDFKEYDIQLASLDVAPSYKFDKNKVSLSFYADNIWYGHENYAATLSLIPQFSRQLDDDLLFNSSFEYSYIKFAKTEDKDKESKVYELENSLDIQTNNFGEFSPKIILGREDRIRGTRSDVAKNYYSLGLINRYKINQEFSLKSGVSTLFRDYLYTDINFQNKREDQKYTFAFSLSYQYLKNMIFNVGIKYINQNSNQAIYDYDGYLLKSSIFYNY